MKQLHFHADLMTIVVYINGQPLALNGTVDVTIKQPTMLHQTDRMVWAQANEKTASAVSLSRVPGQ